MASKLISSHGDAKQARRLALSGRFAADGYGKITGVGARIVTVRVEDLDDAVEDARLNAIADERAGGPFVRVSLDDL